MPLGMKVGLGPGHIMLDGVPGATNPKRGTAPNFWPISIVAERLQDQDATWYGGRLRPMPHCAIARVINVRIIIIIIIDGDPAPPPKKSDEQRSSQLDLPQKDPNTSSPVYCRGTRAKKLSSVLFCPRDWQPCFCEPDLSFISVKEGFLWGYV